MLLNTIMTIITIMFAFSFDSVTSSALFETIISGGVNINITN